MMADALNVNITNHIKFSDVCSLNRITNEQIIVISINTAIAIFKFFICI